MYTYELANLRILQRNVSIRLISVLSLLLIVGDTYGQEFIKITTDENLLLLSVRDRHLQQVSYGKRIADPDLIKPLLLEQSPAMPAFGTTVSGTAVRIKHSDGNLTTDLVYKDHSVTRTGSNSVLTRILLSDAYYALNLTLCYRTFIKENIIEQWVEIENKEKGSVTIYDAASSSLSVSAPSYHLAYFNGDWSNEFNMYQTILQPGILILDSKEGVRTAQKTSPSFLLSLGKKLEEDAGNVIGGTLAWPGNWQISFDVDQAQKLRISAGLSSFASEYHLSPGNTFTAPAFLYTFSEAGAGEITRRFHNWAREQGGIYNGKGKRDLVLNNWETTGMDFNEEKLVSLMKDGKELGMELFLLDDGWFGNKYPRNNDQQGLGDWKVNQAKLPGGLSSTIKQSENLSLKFGLWVEPEMVNPKSELFEKHPEWALTAPNRPLDLQRNQLILDLGNPLVRAHLINVLEQIIKENPGISYLKWDCNRFLTNAWSNYLKPDYQSNLYVDYAKGFLTVLQEFRKKHPSLLMMLCASGGGRMDFGSLKYFDEYWPSDNTNAHDRVRIQWGMNYFFPSVGFAGHVSEMGRPTSIKFRFDVAMAGKLGMDMQISHLSKDEKVIAKQAIADYKKFKEIVLYGNLYRLLSPYENNRAALSYISPDKRSAIVFSYQLQKGTGGDFSTIYLKGLNPDAKYKLNEVNKANYSRFGDYESRVFSGSYLMQQGVRFAMWNVDESVVFSVQEQ